MTSSIAHVPPSPDAPSSERTPADALIVFGLTGDLGGDRLLPAIAELHDAGRLDVPVVGAGRSSQSVDALRDRLGEHTSDADAIELDYVRGDATEASTFDEIARRARDARRPIVYAATPPHLYRSIGEALAGSTFEQPTLIVEKPFGHDAASARTLHAELLELLGADRFRIVDHFLAKSAIEALASIRHANPLLDRVLHRNAVTRVRVDMIESADLAGRGSFYDDVGVVADVVQNHVLQLVAHALMEPPADGSMASWQHRRVEALRSLDISPSSIVLGQFDGYRSLDGVADDSLTPTFASFTMSSSMERWSGVPIAVVTGKALEASITRVVFELDGASAVEVEISPDPGLAFRIRMADPDEPRRVAPTVLDVGTAELSTPIPEAHAEFDAYATMFDDALTSGDGHFARLDDVVEGWRIVEPLTLRSGSEPVRYEPGSDGPGRA